MLLAVHFSSLLYDSSTLEYTRWELALKELYIKGAARLLPRRGCLAKEVQCCDLRPMLLARQTILLTSISIYTYL